MNELYLALVVGTASPAVLLAGLFRALSTGSILTRREADGIIAAAQRETAAAYADRDTWRETAETLSPDVQKMLMESQTTNRLLRGLPGIKEVDSV